MAKAQYGVAEARSTSGGVEIGTPHSDDAPHAPDLAGSREELRALGIPLTDEQLIAHAASGDERVVRLLLQGGLLPNVEAREGMPLEVAAYHGHAGVVRALLEHGADPNQGSSSPTPLCHAVYGAVRGGHDTAAAARALIEGGADVRVPTCYSVNLLSRNPIEGTAVGLAVLEGETALADAMMDVVEELRGRRTPARDGADAPGPMWPIRARVNAPGDGFLALRSEPSTASGRRLARMPHGAVVAVYECLPTPGDDYFQWCPAEYEGQRGYAYNAYLDPLPR